MRDKAVSYDYQVWAHQEITIVARSFASRLKIFPHSLRLRKKAASHGTRSCVLPFPLPAKFLETYLVPAEGAVSLTIISMAICKVLPFEGLLEDMS